ncbi:hypothetical protein C8R42DRAFT_643136 [Lentinula raphanica]|nr:hypothetical protein C8R42DRAFT_643136 [Lentinula raphanica]
MYPSRERQMLDGLLYMGNTNSRDFSFLLEDNPDLQGDRPLGSIYVGGDPDLTRPQHQGRAASRFVGRENTAQPNIPRLRVPGENDDEQGSVIPSTSTPLICSARVPPSVQQSAHNQSQQSNQSTPLPRDTPSIHGSVRSQSHHSIQSQADPGFVSVGGHSHRSHVNRSPDYNEDMDYRSDFGVENLQGEDFGIPPDVDPMYGQRKRQPSRGPPTPDRAYQRRRPAQDVPLPSNLPRGPAYGSVPGAAAGTVHAPIPVRAALPGLPRGFVHGVDPYAAQAPFNAQQPVNPGYQNYHQPYIPQFQIQPIPQHVNRISYRSGGKLRVPFPRVTQAKRPTSDPAGLLTGVCHEVIEILRDGWNEVIPLGYFARRYSPLVSNHAPSSAGGNGLPDIPIIDMSINDWNEIKRNLPHALQEHLIPEHEVVPGTEEAMAAAEMIETFFGIIDNRSRLSDEVVPLMMYADQKITFWRFRPEQDERMDVFDTSIYRDIYEEWKKQGNFLHRTDLLATSFRDRSRNFGVSFVAGNTTVEDMSCPEEITSNKTIAGSTGTQTENVFVLRSMDSKGVVIPTRARMASISAQYVARPNTTHNLTLEERFPIRTRLKAAEWRRVLFEPGVLDRFLDVPEGIEKGFDIGVEKFSLAQTFIPDNYFKTETEAAIVRAKFTEEIDLGRISPPFDPIELEDLIGFSPNKISRLCIH